MQNKCFVFFPLFSCFDAPTLLSFVLCSHKISKMIWMWKLHKAWQDIQINKLNLIFCFDFKQKSSKTIFQVVPKTYIVYGTSFLFSNNMRKEVKMNFINYRLLSILYSCLLFPQHLGAFYAFWILISNLSNYLTDLVFILMFHFLSHYL